MSLQFNISSGHEYIPPLRKQPLGEGHSRHILCWGKCFREKALDNPCQQLPLTSPREGTLHRWVQRAVYLLHPGAELVSLTPALFGIYRASCA